MANELCNIGVQLAAARGMYATSRAEFDRVRESAGTKVFNVRDLNRLDRTGANLELIAKNVDQSLAGDRGLELGQGCVDAVQALTIAIKGSVAAMELVTMSATARLITASIHAIRGSFSRCLFDLQAAVYTLSAKCADDLSELGVDMSLWINAVGAAAATALQAAAFKALQATAAEVAKRGGTLHTVMEVCMADPECAKAAQEVMGAARSVADAGKSAEIGLLRKLVPKADRAAKHLVDASDDLMAASGAGAGRIADAADDVAGAAKGVKDAASKGLSKGAQLGSFALNFLGAQAISSGGKLLFKYGNRYYKGEKVFNHGKDKWDYGFVLVGGVVLAAAPAAIPAAAAGAGFGLVIEGAFRSARKLYSKVFGGRAKVRRSLADVIRATSTAAQAARDVNQIPGGDVGEAIRQCILEMRDLDTAKCNICFETVRTTQLYAPNACGCDGSEACGGCVDRLQRPGCIVCAAGEYEPAVDPPPAAPAAVGDGAV